MTINLTDLGCEVADEEVKNNIEDVKRKVIPRPTLTANMPAISPKSSPFEISFKKYL